MKIKTNIKGGKSCDGTSSNPNHNYIVVKPR